MATLHVRNVPEGVYEALRGRAAAHGRSINAETIALLEPALAGTGPKLSARDALSRMAELRSRQSPRSDGLGVVELIRADRDR